MVLKNIYIIYIYILSIIPIQDIVVNECSFVWPHIRYFPLLHENNCSEAVAVQSLL